MGPTAEQRSVTIYQVVYKNTGQVLYTTHSKHAADMWISGFTARKRHLAKWLEVRQT
jgi:hypothetical protein